MLTMQAKANQPTFTGKRTKFVEKLYALVQDPLSDDAIRWSADGTSFQVFDKERLSVELGNYFRTKEVLSFIRQLHIYGFKRMESDKIDKDLMIYMRPDFSRDRPDLIQHNKPAVGKQSTTQLTKALNALQGEVKELRMKYDSVYQRQQQIVGFLRKAIPLYQDSVGGGSSVAEPTEENAPRGLIALMGNTQTDAESKTRRGVKRSRHEISPSPAAVTSSAGGIPNGIRMPIAQTFRDLEHSSNHLANDRNRLELIENMLGDVTHHVSNTEFPTQGMDGSDLPPFHSEAEHGVFAHNDAQGLRNLSGLNRASSLSRALSYTPRSTQMQINTNVNNNNDQNNDSNGSLFSFDTPVTTPQLTSMLGSPLSLSETPTPGLGPLTGLPTPTPGNNDSSSSIDTLPNFQ